MNKLIDEIREAQEEMEQDPQYSGKELRDIDKLIDTMQKTQEKFDAEEAELYAMLEENEQRKRAQRSWWQNLIHDNWSLGIAIGFMAFMIFLASLRSW